MAANLRDALGHERRAPAPTWPAVLGWRYLDGYAPSELAEMHCVTPRAVLMAAHQIGCEGLYLLGTRWTDADGNPGPRWNPAKAWGPQWDAAQALLAADTLRRRQLRALPKEAAARPRRGSRRTEPADEVAPHG
jgi:hypothetical protein